MPRRNHKCSFSSSDSEDFNRVTPCECRKAHKKLHCKSHIRKCCKDPNIKTALAALDAFRAGDIARVLTFFAAGGVVDFHAEGSIPPSTTPVVPFGGTFPAAQFFALINQFLTNFAISAAREVQFSCDFNLVTLTVDLTAAPRCTPTGPTGPTATNEYLLKFTFNDNCQIARIDIYGDVSNLVLFFTLVCGNTIASNAVVATTK